MRRNIFTFFLLALTCSCYSQQAELSVISPAGGKGITPAMSLQWTLGEIAVSTLKSGLNMITEGFHQPVKVYPAAETRITIKYTTGININVAPNPVISVVNVNINSNIREQLLVTVTNLTGITIYKKEVSSKLSSLQLNLTKQIPGMYSLTVRSILTGKIIKSFQLIKLPS